MTETKPSFVYTTYINGPPEKVFCALQDPETTRRFWGRYCNVSDWQTGSRWEHRDHEEPGSVAVVGTVIENDPPRRLVLTWARPGYENDPARTSRVTFEVTRFRSHTRLTVLHEELDPETHTKISHGWPGVLSALKTLLETGRPLPGSDEPWRG